MNEGGSTQPRVIWCGARGEMDQLAQLADDVSSAVDVAISDHQKPPPNSYASGPYTAHITMFRVKESRALRDSVHKSLQGLQSEESSR